MNLGKPISLSKWKVNARVVMQEESSNMSDLKLRAAQDLELMLEKILHNHQLLDTCGDCEKTQNVEAVTKHHHKVDCSVDT